MERVRIDWKGEKNPTNKSFTKKLAPNAGNAIEINDFLRMMKKIDKKSFNIIDLVQNGAVRIDGKLKRTHYAWDIESFLNNMNEKYNKV